MLFHRQTIYLLALLEIELKAFNDLILVYLIFYSIIGSFNGMKVPFNYDA